MGSNPALRPPGCLQLPVGCAYDNLGGIPRNEEPCTCAPEWGHHAQTWEQFQTAQPSPEFEELLRKAAANRGTPENIQEWAHKLASSVAHLTD